MNRPVLGLALASVALSACGHRYGRRVPDELLTRLPYESRIELLEAENDYGVALDKRDESENEVVRTRDAIRRAKDRRSAAGDEDWRARDAVSKEVARLAIDEADARVEYLRSRQEVNERQLDIEDLAVDCARAHLEQARINIARKTKVAGSEKLEPKDFDEQVKGCDAELAQRRKETAELEKRAQTQKSAWETRKGALARKTFDARASPYVE